MKERHILALSGGKDSAALAVYMKEKYPHITMDYVFTDSGCELPETYEYLDRIQGILNIKIIKIKSTQNFDYWVSYFGGVLPSPSNRWCTRLLKLNPFNKWLNNNYKGFRVYSYVGLRADEDRLGYRPNAEDVIPVHPFISDGLVLDDVKYILTESGIGLPSYYSWRQRSGCYFCFFQRDDEWRGLREFHPELFESACAYEENHRDGRSYTWRDSGPLRDLTKVNKLIINEQSRVCKPFLKEALANITVSKKLDSFIREIKNG